MTVSLQFAGVLDASPRHERVSRREGPKLSPDSFPGQRISKTLSAHSDQICSRKQKFEGVTAGLYSTHADDGNANAPTYLRNLGD